MSSPRGNIDVLVRHEGGAWSEPTSFGYAKETELQELLSLQPSLIEGVSKTAVAVREFSTGAGPADLVIVDADGSITVVECKLATNADIRRTIIGQVLDYASRLAEMTPAAFVNQWQLQDGPSLDALFDGRPDEARQALEANLSAGVFTLVLAVDSINEDLRRIVRYLNTHTSAGMRLLAIELRRAVYGNTDILIPTVYGAESADEKDARRSNGSSVRWTPADVDRYLRERGEDSLADALAAFESEMADAGFRRKGGGEGQAPSYSIWGSTSDGVEIVPFSVYCSDRSLSCNFEWTARASRPAQERFLSDLLKAGAKLRADVITAADFRKRPGTPLSILLDPATRAAVVAAARRLTEASPETSPSRT
ncbi:hypothetical protein [Modestobacter sp. VKM Ac-2984]|uniref:hypothetical protein n=1 Tax=Modestobacter sp. VKM Ac-2984 TaxID=3004138 RepID=UPI0022AA4157|nr:hypothetical protein [Modestobacter sp. VKM Ac-2984]MCZ2817870.1 hypothetical protein [Modestobacter sp. VKM Ac-2984]